MRKIVVYELLSLDGVAEDPDSFFADWDDAMEANNSYTTIFRTPYTSDWPLPGGWFRLVVAASIKQGHSREVAPSWFAASSERSYWWR